jgi:hypothetical protein
MTGEWIDREMLVTVKAYPNPSTKYIETVCVAGITREEGWVRLHPVSYRSLSEDRRFKKYQLVSLRMQKHDGDRRRESFRPDEHSFVLGRIARSDNLWEERWQWIRPTIGPTMCEFLRNRESDPRSLGCIKPRDVDRLVIEEGEAEWGGRKKTVIDQLVLFDRVDMKLEKIPFIFKYRYRCEEKGCRGHEQSILDWELMELYRNLKHAGTAISEIKRKIEDKFVGELCGSDKDTHFFVGNHHLYPVTFMVIGVFWPPKSSQSTLF